jgi:hypothetical protein
MLSKTTTKMVMMTMRTMMTSLLPRVPRAKLQQRKIPTRTTSLKAERRAAKRAAQLLGVTSRSANSNEIKQFKMILKIYHNDN